MSKAKFTINERKEILRKLVGEFGIYHWDTFDNETLLIDEANTLSEAEKKVEKKYGDRIRPDGADQVDIVDKKGNIVKKYRIG